MPSYGVLAQLARALDWQSKGQGFDSPILHDWSSEYREFRIQNFQATLQYLLSVAFATLFFFPASCRNFNFTFLLSVTSHFAQLLVAQSVASYAQQGNGPNPYISPARTKDE